MVGAIDDPGKLVAKFVEAFRHSMTTIVARVKLMIASSLIEAILSILRVFHY
jgi:hypothetical protein